ncbi:MAG TPA: ATP-dependent DNA helicase [Candidatus Thalassarchaeaceae archaeon]|nr:ATP-dependent DNA helicase [Candidatus Thalassarchaeaceae archaeon]
MPPEELTPDVRFLAHDSLREGQIDMINDGLKVISAGGFLLANAPTGIGKTAAALASALTVARSRTGARVLFLTGRQSQHRIVVDTVRKINGRLKGNGRDVTLVDIIGRESMCKDVDRKTGKCSCEQGIAESERSNRRFGLINEIMSEPKHVEYSIEFAEKRRICAWAAAREAASDADILVCDYNHMFLESVRKASLSSMGIELENVIVVVDEAHNLPNRILRSLNRHLTYRMLGSGIDQLREYCDEMEKKEGASTSIAVGRECENALQAFRKKFSVWTKKMRGSSTDSKDIGKKIEEKVGAGEILAMLRQELAKEDLELDTLINQLKGVDQGELDQEDEDEDEELDVHRVGSFLSILHKYELDSALCVVFNSQGNDHRITTHLLDPGIVSAEIFDKIIGGVLMSGTLTPPEMYAETLGIRPGKCAFHSYPSPFLEDRRPVMIAADVTSKFTARGPENTKRIQNHIKAVLQSTPGHVAIFCQSYKMLEEIVGGEYWPGRRTYIEDRTWSKRIVDTRLNDLYNARDGGIKVVLAGVFGGRLSEGVDYSGNILDAVICVGIPIAPQSVSQEALRDYIETKHGRGKGWKYGCIQPAVNSVLQGMGRAIRKVEDRAFILLLDNRLLSGQYRWCLPSTLTPSTANDAKRTGRRVKAFFERHPEPARGE